MLLDKSIETATNDFHVNAASLSPTLKSINITIRKTDISFQTTEKLDVCMLELGHLKLIKSRNSELLLPNLNIHSRNTDKTTINIIQHLKQKKQHYVQTTPDIKYEK